MLWLPLTFLGLAIATRLPSRFCNTHFSRFLGILIAAICVTVSLANAPILFKSLVLIWLLVEPNLRRHRCTNCPACPNYD